jgi:hypothetical protein
MTRRTGSLIALASALAAGAATVAAPAVAQTAPTQARLQGTFQLSGHVTVARHVRGEYVGEVVQRTWAFTPLCATGPCAQVRLVRARATGTDSLILTQTSPGHYAGSGRFFAPLKCAGQVYPTGVEIPFIIKVHVAASTTAADGTTVASAIGATYVNKSRLNLTRCVIVLGHDSARYSGSVLLS